jgi:lycopene beta-cyclase
MSRQTYDIAIVGAGLAGTLTAAFLHRKHPSLTLALIGPWHHRPGQTWSFHAQDLSADANKFLTPLVSRSWPGYSISFPDHSRRLPLTYRTIRSQDYWARIGSFLSGVEKIESGADEVSGTSVGLCTGGTISARVVLDGRGLNPGSFVNTGWQKFVGLEIETARPHGIDEPVIMDATVPQRDGYRFFYLLPYSETRLLIEDTYYSNRPDLKTDPVLREIDRYLLDLGIDRYNTLEQESGSLPIPLDTSWLQSGNQSADHAGAERIGMKGGFFHPTTGYSLPFSVRCAEAVTAAVTSGGSVEKIPAAVRICRYDLARSSGFLVRLNRMLFRAGRPDLRWKILSQFYRRKEKVISGFYSGRLGFATTLSMITGVPPVPVLSGIRHFLADKYAAHESSEMQHG